MAKKGKKKEDETKKVVANCDHPEEVITNCDNQQFEVANCDFKKINIESLIRTIRGQKVMVDFDLAMLYGVQTKALNQAVKRNIERFPDDFMFQLTKEELDSLRSQFVTSNFARMGLRRPPYAFTRNGIGMLSSVLRSETAVEVNIRIMRAFTAIPEIVNNNVLMMQRILSIEQHQTETDEKVNQILLHYKCLYSDAGGLQIRQNDQSVPIRIRVRYYFCGFCVRMLSWKFANRLF